MWEAGQSPLTLLPGEPLYALKLWPISCLPSILIESLEALEFSRFCSNSLHATIRKGCLSDVGNQHNHNTSLVCRWQWCCDGTCAGTPCLANCKIPWHINFVLQSNVRINNKSLTDANIHEPSLGSTHNLPVLSCCPEPNVSYPGSSQWPISKCSSQDLTEATCVSCRPRWPAESPTH